MSEKITKCPFCGVNLKFYQRIEESKNNNSVLVWDSFYCPTCGRGFRDNYRVEEVEDDVNFFFRESVAEMINKILPITAAFITIMILNVKV